MPGHNKPPGKKLFTPKRIEKTGDNQDFNEDVIYVSTGPSHCGFITSSGDVYTFGKNDYLQLGHTSNFTLGPMKVPSIPPMKQIECGELHTVALSESERSTHGAMQALKIHYARSLNGAHAIL
ncbi:unnamed protein product [Blepharisma stoltei]|uniref:Uncharacterized protein n=1 Tax=Blepharisma stoltei TaxID=1481888 RepID=A0AAU9JN04_9CILI|nr:unnamed protein product [Blepharisma stoltei]